MPNLRSRVGMRESAQSVRGCPHQEFSCSWAYSTASGCASWQ